MSQPNKFKVLLWKNINWIILVSVGLLILMIVVVVRASQHLTAEHAALEILAGGVAAGGMYLFTAVLLQRAKDLSRQEDLKEYVVEPIISALYTNKHVVYASLSKVDWSSLFPDTTDIQLLVQGWDGWQDKVSEFLPDFLRKGGTVHLILHDPKNKQLLERMQERMPGKDVKREIENTHEYLRAFVKEVVGEDRVDKQFQCYFIEHVNMYCGIYFKPNKLVLSFYQHTPIGQLPLKKAPAFIITSGDLHFAEVSAWFEAEWNFLTASSNARAVRASR
jgi:hypothetical protein